MSLIGNWQGPLGLAKNLIWGLKLKKFTPFKASIKSSKRIVGYASSLVTSCNCLKSQLCMSVSANFFIKNIGESHGELECLIILRSNIASIWVFIISLVSGSIWNGWVITGSALLTSIVIYNLILRIHHRILSINPTKLFLLGRCLTCAYIKLRGIYWFILRFGHLDWLFHSTWHLA